MFVVLTKTHFKDHHRDAVMEMSDQAVGIAKVQSGFVDIRVHVAHEDNHTMTYWVWETEQDHLNCMTSPDWSDWNPKWEALLGDGVEFELNTYDVLAVA